MLLLLKLAAHNKEQYDEVRRHINYDTLGKHDKIVLQSMEKYYDVHKVSSLDLDEFQEVFLGEQGHKRDAEIFIKLIQNCKVPLTDSVRKCVVNQVIQANIAHNLTKSILEYEAGDEVDLLEVMKENLETAGVVTEEEDDTFATMDDLLNTTDSGSGFTWPLDCMNEHLRPLQGGDDLIVAARPDKGKTTFIGQLCCHIAKQTDGIIVWLNNEGPKKRILRRVVQCSMKISESELSGMQQEGVLPENYGKAIGGNHKIQIYDIHGQSTTDVTAKLKKLSEKYTIAGIVFDMADNVRYAKTRKTDRTDETLEKLYIWVRELATLYNCFTIKTSQVSDPGHGVPFPSENLLKDSRCFAPGTKIRLPDWSLVNIENLNVGDTVMGIDGSSRTVVNTGTGEETMYRVHGKDFEFICNESHNLAVINRQNRTRGGIKPGMQGTITLKDYLSKPTYRLLSPLRCVIESTEKNLIIEPYLFGLWLGDGSTRDGLRITTGDKIIQNYLEQHSWYIRTYKQASDCVDVYLQNPVGWNREKRIPNDYKLGSVKQRLELLAGVIDSDGWLDSSSVITQSIEKRELIKDIQEVAKSLGMKTIYREFFKTCQTGTFKACSVRIAGEIPVKLPWKKGVGTINERYLVDKLEVGKYVGITVDGDHRFCGEDFIALENTGKQGATDTILIIGHDLVDGNENVRYLSAPKNKLRLEGSPHMKVQLVLNADKAFYRE